MQDTEIFLPIPNYKGYEVSNKGAVRSVDRIVNLYGKPSKVKGRKLKPSIDNFGYYHLNLSIECKVKTFKVHKLVCMAFLPTISGKTQINHKDGNKLNNNVDNLEWFTPKENVNHAIATGLNLPTRFRVSKLTDEDVMFIFNSDLKCKDLAIRYNTNTSTINAIKTGRNWGYLTGKEYVKKYKKS